MRGRAVHRFVLLVSCAAVVFGSACRLAPRAGDPCRAPGRTACTTTTDALVCEGGRWRAIGCRGAHGCVDRGHDGACDDTRAGEGDPCASGAGVHYACSSDGASALVCAASRYGVWRRCRGPNACRLDADGRVDCDTTLGEAGDPCAQRGTYCCSTDGRAMLSCDGRVLVAASSCRGPEGCRFDRETRQVSCADGVALLGDPCEDAGRVSCTPEGGLELVCVEGAFTKKRECRRTGCRVEGKELFCD